MQQRKIAFIGAGNMARAIVAGLVNNGYPANLISVTAPSETHRQPLALKYGINSLADNLSAAQQADVVVLAVKPQLLAQVASTLQQQVNWQNKLIISIAAGITISRLEQLFVPQANIVRVMPNTPSMVGEGMAGLFAKANVNHQDRLFSEQLMQAVGKICWLDNEQQINAIIAVAGSAPAYFFYFMQAMEEYAGQLGFDQQQARLLVQQTAFGASKLVMENPDVSLAELRQQVTSKGGTTAQAIASFEQNHLAEIVAQAMQAAINWAIEMEETF